jgi:hypothetical protein
MHLSLELLAVVFAQVIENTTIEAGHMKQSYGRSRILFLNGKEVSDFELTGDPATDLAAARRFIAEQATGYRPRVPRPELKVVWVNAMSAKGLRHTQH